MEEPVNDELMMPCAACCRKHLSAAIAYYSASGWPADAPYWSVVFARALVNLCESTEGYGSHRAFAVGLCVVAEEECDDLQARQSIREFRLALTDRGCEDPFVQDGIRPSHAAMYLAHVVEAEREYPDIMTAVEREPFYRDNMSEPELRQAEVNYRLAQLRWLDENVFGLKAVEKGEEDMACAKKAVKAAAKGGKAKAAPAKKGGCKKCGK